MAVTYDSIEEKLKDAVQRHLPGCAIHVLRSYDEHDFLGFIVAWSGFKDTLHVDRGRILWNIVKSELAESEQQQIVGMFGQTPEEFSAKNEEE